MIFPKVQALYENLNTSFTNVGELLLDLQTNSITGYIQVSFLEYEGILFLIDGKIVNAIEETEGKRKTGQDALINITARAKNREGTISIYSLSREMVNMLSGVVESEVVHKDLSTEYTSLEKLIAKLQGEGHTGYVEVNFMGERGSGIIFLQAGEPIESIMSTGGEVVSGADILPRIVQAASNFDATFNVYKAAVEQTFSEGTEIIADFDLSQLLEIWGVIINTAERVTEGLSENGHFLNVFKDTQIEKADEYPFLNPFDSVFEYKDGVVTFYGESVTNLNRGLGECLGAAVSKLAAESPGTDLAGLIRTELAPAMETNTEIIKIFNLEEILSDLLV
jgi:hypothetical protein